MKNPSKSTLSMTERPRRHKLPRKSPKGKLADHPAFQELERRLSSGQLDPDRTAAFLKSNHTPKDPAMEKGIQLNIRVTPALKRALKMEAARLGLSMQDTITAIILESPRFKGMAKEPSEPQA